MEPHEDSWESVGWAAEQDLDREEVLRLARSLAEQRERQRAEDLAELEELKRALRERAADVAAREAEVERRRLELEERDAASRGERLRRLRFHRTAPGGASDAAYTDELVTRREAEIEQRLAGVIW